MPALRALGFGSATWDQSPALLSCYCLLDMLFYLSGLVSSSLEFKVPSSYQGMKRSQHSAFSAYKSRNTGFQITEKWKQGDIWTKFWDYITKLKETKLMKITWLLETLKSWSAKEKMNSMQRRKWLVMTPPPFFLKSSLLGFLQLRGPGHSL